MWQVTRHEYEVETSNGRTITKRRKTKSTVMFGVGISHLELPLQYETRLLTFRKV